jgi:hypothetical protein
VLHFTSELNSKKVLDLLETQMSWISSSEIFVNEAIALRRGFWSHRGSRRERAGQSRTNAKLSGRQDLSNYVRSRAREMILYIPVMAYDCSVYFVTF